MRKKSVVGMLTLALCLLSAAATSADLIISEVIDGTVSSGNPKFVELTNCGTESVDLAQYRLVKYTNGATTATAITSYGEFTGTLAAGASYVISAESAVFETVYGSSPDFVDSGANGNGNDVYELQSTGDVVVDTFGLVGDATNFYLDSYAYSLPGRSANGGVWNAADWFLAGNDVLDGVDAAGHAAVTNPGTHVCAGDITGACCQGESCIDGLTQAECEALDPPGVYQGDALTCEADTCYPGACCIDDGMGGETCELLTQALCQAASGYFEGVGTTCTPNPCGPVGACCGEAPLYICDDYLTEEECLVLGRTWLGAGTYCDQDCGPTGSCCLWDGSCVLDVTEPQCLDMQGHDWTEGGTDCIDCVATPMANLIISEYYESSSNRKALEIYNVSTEAASLNGHSLMLYSNGSATPTGFFRLDGLTIPAQSVLVFLNNTDDDIPDFDEGTAIVARSAINFNGDDAIAIGYGSVLAPTVVDRFGVPDEQDSGPRGTDPYKDAAWERDCGVSAGTPDFDSCNFDGQKGCTAPCAPGASTAECDDGLWANTWVFEGLNPDGDNSHHTLGTFTACEPATGACCVEIDLPRACSCPGDMTGDNAVDVADITDFVDVLIGAAPANDCADTNTDGAIDGRDVQSFVQLILDGTVCNPGGCSVITAAECIALGGTYMGNDTVCEPDPCGPRGACCAPDQTDCFDDLSEAECAAWHDGYTWLEGGLCSEDCLPPIPEDLVINEFWADDGYYDTIEYIELYCGSCGGQSLAGLSLIVMDGDIWYWDGDPQVQTYAESTYKSVDLRIDLAGHSMPADGYLLIGAGYFPDGIDVDIEIDLDDLENGSATYAIVRTADLEYCVEDTENPGFPVAGCTLINDRVLTDGSVALITANLVDAIATTDDLDDVWEDAVYFGAPDLETNFGADVGSRIPNGVDTDTVDDWVVIDTYADAIELYDEHDQISSPGYVNSDAPLGYCCHGVDECSDVSPADCTGLGGTWKGRMWDCTSNPYMNPCVEYAPCCLPDESCVLANQVPCEAAGGMWQPAFSECVEGLCTPVGACCLPDESCADMSALQCMAATGVFLGVGTDCATHGGACVELPVYCLIISEIVDATETGGLPKFVELTNTGDVAIDLSGYSLANYNNGASTLGHDALVLAGTLDPGDSFVVSYEDADAPGSSMFYTVYGFDADDLSQGSYINGDDVMVLFEGAAIAGDPADGSGQPVVDVYGVVGVDGTGEVWEYMDSYAYRIPISLEGNLGAFDPGDWVFGGVNALDGAGPAGIVAATDPGVHTFTGTCGDEPPAPPAARTIRSCDDGTAGYECPADICRYAVYDAGYTYSYDSGAFLGLPLCVNEVPDFYYVCVPCPAGGGNCEDGLTDPFNVPFHWINYDGAGSDCWILSSVDTWGSCQDSSTSCPDITIYVDVREVVECGGTTGVVCDGDTPGVDYCLYQVTSTDVGGDTCATGLAVDDIICVPCQGGCDAQNTFQTFKWIDANGTGLHCFFEAKVYQPLPTCTGAAGCASAAFHFNDAL